MVNWVSSSAIGGLKRLLIGATLLPGKSSSRQSFVYYSRDSRDIWQVTINTTRRHPVALASSFWKPAVAPFHVPNRLSSFTVCKSKMVNSVEAASVAESNGYDNGHSAGQEDLVDSPTLFKEIQIPLSWGHLAAKIWGTPNDHPILALHGWQDNAGTFDKLIPLLPSDLYVVCLDFCGHGLSSHYPKGMMYHYWDHIAHIRLVAEYFGWSRFSILGHSLGGIVGSMFTAISPSMVDKLVMIDIVKPISTPARFQPDKSAKAIESYIQVLKKLEQSPPSYTYEAARERLVQANNGSIDAEAAEVLMRRGTKRHEDGGYYFSRDLRHVIPTVASYTAEQHAEYAKRVHCPLLLITAKGGFIYEDRSVIEDFIQIYRDVSKGGFQHAHVDGTHHVHLVNPENIASIVGKFLSHDAQQSTLEN
ncbi:hypothetical protein GHT06_012403 [Daphnia sinensis]|uniref:AB hydrolase-1 domain-containing protein n=1 Tax=Daphnia sinensis TaxID=1820382 RepID=A0AAD5LEW0_9CRUS|nr:hypothetical protein GHT06_012403 [Daphnia sinensis]